MRCRLAELRYVAEKGVPLCFPFDQKSPSWCFSSMADHCIPELFVRSTASRTVRRGDYQATVDITNAGHVVTWRYQALTLTEVATSAHHPLPQKRRLLSYG